MSDLNKYEVYVCKFKGEVVYVGQGLIGRSKHCNSGVSHVYELNKIHFSETTNVLVTDVVKFFKNKESALALENELILKLKPKFNKVVAIADGQSRVLLMRKFKNKCTSYIRLSDLNKKFKADVIISLDEYLSCHSSWDIINNGIKFMRSGFYKKHNCTEIAKFIDQVIINKDGLSRGKAFVLKYALERAFSEVFDEV